MDIRAHPKKVLLARDRCSDRLLLLVPTSGPACSTADVCASSSGMTLTLPYFRDASRPPEELACVSTAGPRTEPSSSCEGVVEPPRSLDVTFDIPVRPSLASQPQRLPSLSQYGSHGCLGFPSSHGGETVPHQPDIVSSSQPQSDIAQSVMDDFPACDSSETVPMYPSLPSTSNIASALMNGNSNSSLLSNIPWGLPDSLLSDDAASVCSFRHSKSGSGPSSVATEPMELFNDLDLRVERKRANGKHRFECPYCTAVFDRK